MIQETMNVLLKPILVKLAQLKKQSTTWSIGSATQFNELAGFSISSVRLAEPVDKIQSALKEVLNSELPIKNFLAEVLPSVIENFQSEVEVRKRIYPPETIIEMMVISVLSRDNTLQAAIVQNNKKRAVAGLPTASLNTAAFSEARQKLAVEILIESVKKSADVTVKEFASKTQDDFWGNFSSYAIDGSTFTANDTIENQAEFPQHGTQEKGIGFPIVRILILQSLMTGMVCNAAMAPFRGKETGEMALSRQILSNLPKNSLLIGDRYFPSFFTMADLIKNGSQGIFPTHAARNYDFRKGKKLGHLDHIVEWDKPKCPKWMSQEEYENYPKKITLRELDVSKEIGYKKFVLATTILDNVNFNKNKLSEFYKKRWNIELAYRDLKTTFGMEHIAANTPEMIKKLFWNFLLSYNTLRWHMLNIAILFKKPLDQISVKTTSRVMSENKDLISTADPSKLKEVLITLYDQIARVNVGLRPDRKEPRAIKKRPKPFPRLHESRSDWRARKSA